MSLKARDLIREALEYSEDAVTLQPYATTPVLGGMVSREADGHDGLRMDHGDPVSPDGETDSPCHPCLQQLQTAEMLQDVYWAAEVESREKTFDRKQTLTHEEVWS